MNPRHQIYIRVKASNYGPKHPNNHKSMTVGFHHRWLYGHTALTLLDRALLFVENGGLKYHSNPAETAMKIAACYECIPEAGYYHRVDLLREDNSDSYSSCGGRDGWDQCCEDPTTGDNNDGITVIDLTGDVPRYCFASVHHLDGVIDPEVGRPMSAEEYLHCYHPKWDTEETAEDRELYERVQAVRKRLKGFKLITPSQFRKIFPKWGQL